MPTRFSEEHIELIRMIPLDRIGVLPSAPQWSKQFWFRYFWQEAIARPSEFRAQSERILDFFNETFFLPERWNQEDENFGSDELRVREDNVLIYKSGGPGARHTRFRAKRGEVWNSIGNDSLLSILTALLHAGFTRIRVANMGHGKPQDSSITFAANSHSVQSDGPAYKFDIGWRGDGRTLHEISQAGGFLCRAESDYQGFAARCNLREDWHPFNDQQTRADYWYREGQSDNCLHTTISVALEFQTAATFPLTEQKLKYLSGHNPATAQEAQQLSKAEAPLKAIGISADGRDAIYRYADRQQLYMVIIDSECFDTRKQQKERFPEIAVKQLPATRIMACVSFVRVFHGSEDDQGFTALCDRARCTAPTLDRCIAVCSDRALGTLLYRRVQRAYDDTCNSMPFGTKWTPSGAATGIMKPRLMAGRAAATVYTVKELGGNAFWP
jgi:hypothetical protein